MSDSEITAFIDDLEKRITVLEQATAKAREEIQQATAKLRAVMPDAFESLS